MKLVLSGNQLFQSISSKIPPKPNSPMGSQPDSSSQLSPGITPSTRVSGIGGVPTIQLKKKPNVILSLTPVAVFAGLALLTVPLGLYLCKLKEASSSEPPSSLVSHPWTRLTRITQSGFQSPMTPRCILVLSVVRPIIKSGNMIISVQVLKKCDQKLRKKSDLGHGRFGVVYKGQLDDGTKIAVKRMESGVISNKALLEFESEISVLIKV
ncbi:putative protein kinase RLK-Pelle-LRR-IX family [Helianthus annuus]|nr:putative protein kinase RLK-Pelle-LRR-IX family [Helianthus annuus]